MIKKIYDRDTGNIYDVGADSKLKLVAEGSFEEHPEDERCVVRPYNFENNKMYVLVVKYLSLLHCTLIGWCYDDRFVTSYGLTEGDEVICFISKKSEPSYAYNVNADYVEGLSNYNYEIYELPFSM